MSFVKTNSSSSGEEVKLAYEDIGSGRPVVLIHGWPLCKEMWEYQIETLVNNGLRVITYDRRGFGNSSKPWNNYDYDTLADDLKALLDHLDLQDVTLVGFSMGGGEVVRYFSKHGGARVTKAVLLGAVTPFMLKTPDNPDGAPQEMFDGMAQQMRDDRIGFLDGFGKTFFGVNLVNHPISTPLLEYFRTLASFASPRATLQCATSFSSTDFRGDMAALTVPTLIIHGSDDKTVPIEISGDKSKDMIANNQYIVYDGEPHGFWYTAKERLNQDLVKFING